MSKTIPKIIYVTENAVTGMELNGRHSGHASFSLDKINEDRKLFTNDIIYECEVKRKFEVISNCIQLKEVK